MKRISLLTILMLTLASGPTIARTYYPVRYRTRWSPYAFGLVSGDVRYSPYAFDYKQDGLVCGNVHYSPYAFSSKHSGLVWRNFRYSPYAFSNKDSGLVCKNIRYSPYAFSYKHSGLVADLWYESYGCSHAPCHRIYPAPVGVVDSAHCCPSTCNHRHNVSSDETNNSYEEKLIARRERIKKLRDSKKQINMMRGKDGKEIICTYLKSRNIDDFEMKGILRVNNKTVNINFLFRDKSLFITYWDLDEVQSLIQQPGYKRNYYERHKQTWRNFCEKYKQAGGKVYQINSANEQDILAKLMRCPELNDG